MYFKEFPKFLYDFKYGSTTKTTVVTDITRNIRFRKEIFENVTLFDEYDIVDGETPEIVAEKIYGDPEYHWIIMLANQKYDYISDFPLDYNSLIAWVAKKYNPILYSDIGEWRFENGKIYAFLNNIEDTAELPYLTSPIPFTINGVTEEHGAFTISDVFGSETTGLNFDTQEFFVETAVTGTPSGKLSITTTDREYEPLYFIDARGYKVTPDAPGATSVSGLQEEEKLNESKRRIKVISPQVISTILTQYKELL
jgi:hypothetical protein